MVRSGLLQHRYRPETLLSCPHVSSGLPRRNASWEASIDNHGCVHVVDVAPGSVDVPTRYCGVLVAGTQAPDEAGGVRGGTATAVEAPRCLPLATYIALRYVASKLTFALLLQEQQLCWNGPDDGNEAPSVAGSTDGAVLGPAVTAAQSRAMCPAGFVWPTSSTSHLLQELPSVHVADAGVAWQRWVEFPRSMPHNKAGSASRIAAGLLRDAPTAARVISTDWHFHRADLLHLAIRSARIKPLADDADTTATAALLPRHCESFDGVSAGQEWRPGAPHPYLPPAVHAFYSKLLAVSVEREQQAAAASAALLSGAGAWQPPETAAQAQATALAACSDELVFTLDMYHGFDAAVSVGNADEAGESEDGIGEAGVEWLPYHHPAAGSTTTADSVEDAVAFLRVLANLERAVLRWPARYTATSGSDILLPLPLSYYSRLLATTHAAGAWKRLRIITTAAGAMHPLVRTLVAAHDGAVDLVVPQTAAQAAAEALAARQLGLWPSMGSWLAGALGRARRLHYPAVGPLSLRPDKGSCFLLSTLVDARWVAHDPVRSAAMAAGGERHTQQALAAAAAGMVQRAAAAAPKSDPALAALGARSAQQLQDALRVPAMPLRAAAVADAAGWPSTDEHPLAACNATWPGKRWQQHWQGMFLSPSSLSAFYSRQECARVVTPAVVAAARALGQQQQQQQQQQQGDHHGGGGGRDGGNEGTPIDDCTAGYDDELVAAALNARGEAVLRVWQPGRSVDTDAQAEAALQPRNYREFLEQQKVQQQHPQ